MDPTSGTIQSAKSVTIGLIVVPYNQVRWKYVAMRYDLIWSGLAEYEGVLYKANTYDLTDYDAMGKACPSCSIDGDPLGDPPCICEAYPDTEVRLTPLTFWERLTWRYNTIRLFRN